jgi:hypothetical protein
MVKSGATSGLVVVTGHLVRTRFRFCLELTDQQGHMSPRRRKSPVVSRRRLHRLRVSIMFMGGGPG